MTARFFALIVALALFAGCGKQVDPTAGTTSGREVTDFSVDVLARSQTTPVLVDFWASWCGPCKMLRPVLEKAALHADGRWLLVAVNVDDHPDLSEKFGIQSIPNVKLFYRGKIVADFVGMKSVEELRVWLDASLSPGNAAPKLP